MKRKFLLMGALALIVAGGIFWSCQKEEIIDSENALKKAKIVTQVVEEITLNYPAEVNVNEDFDIVFSSTCGKLFIERGYILDTDGVTKIYNDLDCSSSDVIWEGIESGGFTNCAGGTHTLNLSEAGTYIYRTKWNANAENRSDCINCEGFNGNQMECFVVTVIGVCENWQTETAFGGETSGVGKSWWFYYDGEGSQKIWAGQHIEAGTVEIIEGDLVISLSNGWELEDDSDAVKIFGFNSAPEERPNPGQNPDELLYQGDETTIESIDEYAYYVIHLDVRKCADIE